MSEALTVTVRILDRDYQVSCVPDEVDGLVRAARSLNERLAEIRQAGRVAGLDRIAVMAALNYAHEYLLMKDRLDGVVADNDDRIERLAERVTAVLSARERRA